MAKARKSKQAGRRRTTRPDASSKDSKGKSSRGGRPDQRFKDQAKAPGIVSEKRLTFFVPEVTYRQLRLYAGLFQAANAERDDGLEVLPESPSALLREAVHFYIDQLRSSRDRVRTPATWDKRFSELRNAMKKFS